MSPPLPDNILTVLASDPAVARAMGPSRRRMLTTLLLAIPAEAIELISWYRQAVVKRQYSSDPAIVFSLFRALDRKGKIDLATSFCGSSLDTRNFVKLMSLVYRTCSPSGEEKDQLAQTISRHASVHWPIPLPAFEKLVRTLLTSRRSWERAHGLLCLAALPRVHEWHVRRVTQLVEDSASHVRANAWIAASGLVLRRALSGTNKQVLLQASAAALEDEYKTASSNARRFRRYAHGQVRR